jgi:hypothetical protein
MQEALCQQSRWDFSDLRALFINCTLKRSPEVSNTQGLAGISMELMRRPGPSYLDAGSGGPENDFTNRNTTFMTWNLLHLARMVTDAGGIPVHGNQRAEWDAGCRFDFPNPEYR